MTRGAHFLRAARAIPAGETRTFGELAALAGAPSAARAAGRALRAARDAPWHRVVRSDGGLDAERGARQLALLRREGARPRAGESVDAWARRRGLTHVASLATGRLYAVDDPRVARLDPTRLEGFADVGAAHARRFAAEGRAVPARVPLPRTTARGRSDNAALARRLGRLDWTRLEHDLARRGVTRVPRLLTPTDCGALLRAGSDPARFDRETHMEAKGYGVGSYRYWKEPPPEPARTLRRELYARLHAAAERLEPACVPLPRTLAGYHRACRAAGQRRPSSILISYLAGGVNHPHQDAYGPLCFPVQALVVLSRRGKDFRGGDFVLWTGDEGEQTRAVPADRGDLVLFASRRLGPDGPRALHGMRPLTSGRRDALGIVLHLAE